MRFRRILLFCFWAIVIVSVPAFILVMSLLVRSYTVADYWMYSDGRGRMWGVTSNAGVVHVSVTSWGFGLTRQFRHNTADGSNIGDRGWSMFYFDRGGGGVYLGFPHLLPAIVFAGATAFFYRLGHRWRNFATGCPNCGYDLRASPERCPECGRPVDVPAKPDTPT